MDRMDAVEKKVDEPQKSSKIIYDISRSRFLYLLQYNSIFLKYLWVHCFLCLLLIEHSQLNDTTIEERVTILEFQVSGLTQDVTDLGVEVTDLGDEIDVIDGEVAVIFAGQIIQDERILELEADSESK